MQEFLNMMIVLITLAIACVCLGGGLYMGAYLMAKIAGTPFFDDSDV